MQHKYRAIAIVFLAACLLFAGLILFESHYKGALSALSDWSLSEWSFSEASSRLRTVPDFYRDARQLKQYVAAGECFYREEYEQASSLFRELGDYKDSPNFLLECKYRQATALMAQEHFTPALALLDTFPGYRDADALRAACNYAIAQSLLLEGKHFEARALFEPLAAQGYENAASFLSEANYRIAREHLDAGDASAALRMLRDLLPYANAADALEVLEETLYTRAADCYAAAADPTIPEHEGYWAALQLFTYIPTYRDSASYITLCNMLQESYEHDTFETMEAYHAYHDAQYKRLRALWEGGFAPAGQELACRYPDEFLEGRWKGGGKSLKVSINRKKGDILYLHDLPGAGDGSIRVSYGVFSVRDAGGTSWTPLYDYTFSDMDTVSFYVRSSQKTYTLKRQ